MGIFNRDYLQDERPSWSDGGGGGAGLPPAVKWILIANIVIFLGQIFFTRDATVDDLRFLIEDGRVTEDQLAEQLLISPVQVETLTQALKTDSRKLLDGQIWRIFTGAFCHSTDTLWHIVFNMLFLVWFGRVLEGIYGTREFLAFYLVAAVLANVAFVGLELSTGGFKSAIGASGAVMAVLMNYALHFPRSIVYVFFVIPLQIRWLVLFYVIFDLFPVVQTLAGRPAPTGVAHAAHLGGLAFGFLYYRFGWKLDRWGGRRGRGTRIRSVPFVRRDRPQSGQGENRQHLDQEVDRILAKVSAEGLPSLTPKERETLRRASEQYRGR